MTGNQPDATPTTEQDFPEPIIPPQHSSNKYAKRLIEILSSFPSDSEIQRLYFGRAGEQFVASHLLRRGLNSATLPVDTGVDLLAHCELKLDELMHQAEHELYQFQVKTTTTSEYRASMPVRKVHELWHKVINLVVVFWSEETAPSAIVLPPSLIRMLTSGRFEDSKAPLVTSSDEVSLRVFESNGRFFIRNLDNEITAMKNRFDRIEPVGTDTGHFPYYAHWSDDESLVAFDPN